MPEHPPNESKGNACVARSAPLGLLWLDSAVDPPLDDAFEAGRKCAALTHGDPVAQDAAGAFAAIVAAIAAGRTPEAAAYAAYQLAGQRSASQEVINHLNSAIGLAGSGTRIDDLPRKWRGLVAEEALAIAVYSALSATDFSSGIRLAVNHSGNSDATGAICGALLGTYFGPEALSAAWLDFLEARGTIEIIASDFARIVDHSYRATSEDDRRYPGQ
jgi:ADP-ribosylglycohydrolase